MNNELIQLKKVYKIFENEGTDVAIIKGISLSIRRGEKVVIIGSSGSGKTTLMNILIGKLKPNAGQVFWDITNVDISKINESELITLRREFIGYVSQYNQLLPQISVKQNILLGAQIAKIEGDEIHHNFEELTKLLRLTDLLDKHPNTLSEGEKKRVNIAASLITKPQILIADEIVEGLDPLLSNIILDLLDEVNEQLGTTIILTTHDQMVAQRGHRIVELSNGVISASHSNAIDLRKLERTRKLVVDIDGRVHLPNDILKEVDNPEVFSVKIEEGKIILTPLDQDNKNTEA